MADLLLVRERSFTGQFVGALRRRRAPRLLLSAKVADEQEQRGYLESGERQEAEEET